MIAQIQKSDLHVSPVRPAVERQRTILKLTQEFVIVHSLFPPTAVCPVRTVHRDESGRPLVRRRMRGDHFSCQTSTGWRAAATSSGRLIGVEWGASCKRSASSS